MCIQFFKINMFVGRVRSSVLILFVCDHNPTPWCRVRCRAVILFGVCHFSLLIEPARSSAVTTRWQMHRISFHLLAECRYLMLASRSSEIMCRVYSPFMLRDGNIRSVVFFFSKIMCMCAILPSNPCPRSDARSTSHPCRPHLIHAHIPPISACMCTLRQCQSPRTVPVHTLSMPTCSCASWTNTSRFPICFPIHLNPHPKSFLTSCLLDVALTSLTSAVCWRCLDRLRLIVLTWFGVWGWHLYMVRCLGLACFN